MGFFWGAFVETTVEELRSNEVPLGTSSVSHDPGTTWLGLCEYYDDYPEHLECDGPDQLDEFINDRLSLTREAKLSQALQCRTMVVFGTNSAPGISVRVFEAGRCVRYLDGGEGTWVVRGDGVQPWEAPVVERHIPEDFWTESGELDPEELACHSAVDQRVFRERRLLDGATTPPVSDADLGLIGVDALMYPTNPIRVREEQAPEQAKGWLARLFGR